MRDAVLSPGSRSTPMALALAASESIALHVHHDERSASFMALGLAKAGGRPVALLCTSGTAAAELHAAVVEAHQSFVALIVITADRPPELQGVGAPQTIDQRNLFSSAVRWFCEPGPPQAGGAPWWRDRTEGPGRKLADSTVRQFHPDVLTEFARLGIGATIFQCFVYTSNNAINPFRLIHPSPRPHGNLEAGSSLENRSSHRAVAGCRAAGNCLSKHFRMD